MAVYGRSRSGNVRRLRTSASVGHTNIGYLYSRRGANGQFVQGYSGAPAVIEAFQWASFRPMTRQGLQGHLAGYTKQIDSWVAHLAIKSPDIIKKVLQPTFEKSKLYCPKDTLALVRSARMEIKTSDSKPNGTTGAIKTTTTVSISYGKGGLPFYAIYVHEMLRYRHAPPTRAKFLEAAFKEDMSAIRQGLADSIRQASGR